MPNRFPQSSPVPSTVRGQSVTKKPCELRPHQPIYCPTKNRENIPTNKAKFIFSRERKRDGSREKVGKAGCLSRQTELKIQCANVSACVCVCVLFPHIHVCVGSGRELKTYPLDTCNAGKWNPLVAAPRVCVSGKIWDGTESEWKRETPTHVTGCVANIAFISGKIGVQSWILVCSKMFFHV